tara:strand:+ start:3467 stop:5863 length:2397 start_codon:yes stop_codon:yes gene_type:complete
MRCSKISYATKSLLLAGCLTLSACGGGSPTQLASPSRPTTILPPPVSLPQNPSDFETTEYNADWSLRAINASDAYARGFTGNGAIIGMVDFGFELHNPEIDWHPSSHGPDQRWVDMYESYLGVEVTESHHGHWVSGIAAGRKNSLATQGVAFDAQVLAVDFFAGVNRHTEFSNGVTYTVSDPWGYVVNNGARVVNKSIGYDEEDFISNPPASNGNQHYTITNAARVVELGGLLVAAAGNDGDPDPMVSNIDTLTLINQNNLWASGGFFLVAGSVSPNGLISSFSDRAGILKDYYLVAPGDNISISAEEFGLSGYSTGWRGTSFAAPHVVGAAALLFGQWPQLSAAEVADILLSTATDIGDPGVDAVYGHGLLNLDEATKPSGQTTVAVKSTTAAVILTDGMIVMGTAFGDASPQNLADVMVLDRYNRDFYVDARANVISPPSGLDFNSVLDQRRAPLSTAVQLNSGLTAYISINDTAQATLPPEIFLTEREKLDNKPHLQAWHVTGHLSPTVPWVVGQGYQLHQALDIIDNNGIQTGALFVTDHKSQPGRSTRDMFFASGLPLDVNNRLTFAVTTGTEAAQPDHNLVAYHQEMRRQGLETRLSHNFSRGQIALGLGALWEQNALLGSRSSAGLKLADQTVTGRLSLQGHITLGTVLGHDWTLEARAIAGISDVSTSSASLFEKFNHFTSSQWQTRLTSQNIIVEGDQFGLNLSQPLRVENARVQVTRATGYNLALDAPDFTTQWLNLSPTGREIALEAGYARKTEDWTFSANIIRRFNAGHRAGVTDDSLLLHARTRF